MTKTDYASASDILADAQDIVVLGRSGDNHVYAVKPSLEAQRQLYNESIAEDRNVPAFRGHWKFDDKKGITGSSTFLALRLDQKALRPKGLHIPSLLEAKALEAQGKLENGVYRDYGAVLYTDGNPNREIARELVKHNDLPLVLPFRALGYFPDASNQFGVSLSIVQNPQGIISGEEAEKEIAKLNFKSDSGFLRLGRDGGGSWIASWSILGSSDDYGRVEWFCGEATAQNLVGANDSLVDRKYSSRIRTIEEEKLKAIKRFESSLNQ